MNLVLWISRLLLIIFVVFFVSEVSYSVGQNDVFKGKTVTKMFKPSLETIEMIKQYRDVNEKNKIEEGSATGAQAVKLKCYKVE